MQRFWWTSLLYWSVCWKNFEVFFQSRNYFVSKLFKKDHQDFWSEWQIDYLGSYTSSHETGDQKIWWLCQMYVVIHYFFFDIQCNFSCLKGVSSFPFFTLIIIWRTIKLFRIIYWQKQNIISLNFTKSCKYANININKYKMSKLFA